MIIAYFFDRKKRPLTQVFGVLDASISEKISDVSTAEFSLSNRYADGSPNAHISAENLQEGNFVELWKSDGTREEKFFEGIISAVEAEWEAVKISLSSVVGLLEYRILKNGKKFQGMSVNTMLRTIWDEMTDPPCQLECSDTTNITKSYEIGRSVLEILRDLSDAGFEYRLEGDVLKVGKNIGEDRSESVTYRREWHSPAEWNISDMKVSYFSKNTHNFVLTKIAKSPPYSVRDEPSIAKFGLKEKYISVSGDARVTPSGYLAEHKNPSREIAITPTDTRFTNVSVGDFVGIYIDAGNDILHFAGAVKISEKKFTHGDLDAVEIIVSTSNTKNLSVMEKIKSMDTRLGVLENISVTE